MELHIDGLEETLRRIMREELARDRDGWLDAGAAAEYLGLRSVGTIHNAVSRGDLPRYGAKGTALRFRRSDLDTYAEARR